MKIGLLAARARVACVVLVSAPHGAAAKSPTISAERSRGQIVVDGRLDEPTWRGCEAGGDFWQREPDEGAPPRFASEFCVLHDDDALYVGVRAKDPNPSRIRALLTRRDEGSPSDRIWVEIDSYHDRRTAYAFGLNPAGVQQDCLYYDDTHTDCRWNAVWEGAASIDDQGWVAELRIPFSQLRFSDRGEQVWGLQVRRHVERARETSSWVPWPKSSVGRVSLFGELRGIVDVKSSGRVEAVPYALLGGALALDTGEHPRVLSSFGLDFRLAVTSNFTLFGTINPDFGQVQADPSVVNLSANESFFVEKRPFFLEGFDIYRYRLGGGDNNEELFYTRRIGAPPQGSLDEDEEELVHVPTATAIYGAAKLSGKTESGWSIGVLNAITERVSVRIPVGSGFRTRVLEPLTSYSVLSVNKDFFAGDTKVGAVLTAVHRDLAGSDLDWLHEQAYAGGLSATHRFLDDHWELSLKLMGSSVFGSEEALAETQAAEQHYYQRPDADHLHYDPTRTALHGFGVNLALTRMGGKNWRFATGGDTRSPGFEVNDLGYQRDADYYVHWVWLQYRDDEPGWLLRDYRLNANAWTIFDWGGLYRSTGGNLNTNGQFLNYWEFGGGFGVNGDEWHTSLLRGGPAVRWGPGLWTWVWLKTDSRQPLYANLHAELSHQDSGDAWNLRVDLVATVQVGGQLKLSAGPSWRRALDGLQYWDVYSDSAGRDHTILARLDQTEVGLTLRASYAFSPELSLELYAQPFLSSGAYDRYKEAADVDAAAERRRFSEFRPEELRRVDDIYRVDRDQDGITELEFDAADFGFRELRSNVVVRWEFQPGSTLFLVWSHQRTSEDSDGSFDLWRDVDRLVREQGEHTVLLKLSYRFEP